MATFSIRWGDEQRLPSGCPQELVAELKSRSSWTEQSFASTTFSHLLRSHRDQWYIGDRLIETLVPEELRKETKREFDVLVGGHLVFQGSAEAQWMAEDLANERRRQAGQPPLRRGPL